MDGASLAAAATAGSSWLNPSCGFISADVLEFVLRPSSLSAVPGKRRNARMLLRLTPRSTPGWPRSWSSSNSYS